jgi:hypothetical protein
VRSYQQQQLINSDTGRIYRRIRGSPLLHTMVTLLRTQLTRRWQGQQRRRVPLVAAAAWAAGYLIILELLEVFGVEKVAHALCGKLLDDLPHSV